MGVKNLWDILESCKKKLPLHHLQNKRVCVDLSCWIVQLQNVNRAHCPTRDKVYLKSLFHRLRALMALNCSLIFVTDGSIPAIKLSTYRQRLNTGPELKELLQAGQVLQDAANSHRASSLRRNMGSEFSCMIKEAKALGITLGIPCLDGIEEAEAQCAVLNLESLCDGCFSSDSDIFLFGARTVYRDICLGDGGHVVCYEMSDIERKLGFGRNSLISLALLLGSDYSRGIHGLGPESACKIVQSVGDNLILQKLTSEELSFLKARSSKKHVDDQISLKGRHHSLQKQNQFLQVIEAYMKPKCHSADSEVVHRVLAQHPFQRSKLQELCAQIFDWPPEKTDEYILAKIAERDLHRFANLRSTSSELGVNLPLIQIPVRSPVAEIIKRRKVQGRDCFEILWDGRDGLKTSIVPADLVERACPEKIMEFEVRERAIGKKRNQGKSKARKPDDRTDTDEIGMKLQDLLLETEQASDSSQILSRTVISDEMNVGAEVDVRNLDLSVPLQSEVKTGGRAEVSCLPVVPAIPEHEVIDLVSPSPAVNSRNVARLVESNNQQIRNVGRCFESNDQHISVIDLSDSENDESPEHREKARELRLFLASVRDEFQ